MIKPLVVLATTAVALSGLAACSSGGNSAQKQAESQLSAIQSAEAQASNAAASVSDVSSQDLASIMNSASSAASVPSSDASHIDVCSMLSQADAQSVAMADKLDGAQTSASVYKLTATKEDPGTEDRSACRFDISDGGAEGTVLFEVGPGPGIDLYTDGTKVDGLGDEAYTNSDGGTVVRVGGLLITEGDDSFGGQITLDLLRKMAPNLK